MGVDKGPLLRTTGTVLVKETALLCGPAGWWTLLELELALSIWAFLEVKRLR